MIRLFALLFLLDAGARSSTAQEASAQLQQSSSSKNRIAIPVMLDSVEVYVAIGADSMAARAEVSRVERILFELHRHAATPENIRLREAAGSGAGIILLKGAEVLEVGYENRVDSNLSPLANALAIREQVLNRAIAPSPETSWNEEELLLRLLLGVIYPVSLLVILRLTRTGIRHWEKDWRNAALQWLNRVAAHRGLSEDELQSRRIIHFLAGIVRLVLYGLVFILISFTWFALFPQTQALAIALLSRIIGPLLDLLGGTARGALLLAYSLLVVLLAHWLTRRLAVRRRLSRIGGTGILADPVVNFPLRLLIWILALFMIFFPYPGAPRLLAMGILLIALLALLIALRPLIEEIAAGIYFNSTHTVKTGDRLSVDGAWYVIVTPGLLHMLVLSGEEQHWLPYSRILRADVTMTSIAKVSPPGRTNE